ncbi:hypothetical protein HPB47_001662, partial [Ixodes persulcatus]
IMDGCQEWKERRRTSGQPTLLSSTAPSFQKDRETTTPPVGTAGPSRACRLNCSYFSIRLEDTTILKVSVARTDLSWFCRAPKCFWKRARNVVNQSCCCWPVISKKILVLTSRKCSTNFFWARKIK